LLGRPVEPRYSSLGRIAAEKGGSKNPQGTDNQQERLEPMLKVEEIPRDVGWYLAGFTDGEGSFNVSFRPRQDYTLPWKVSLCFNISQRDPTVLSLFKRHLQCGTMRQRQDGVWYYEVNNLTPICDNVIPFFETFYFLSAKKKRDFAKFKDLAALMRRGRHLNREGIQEILAIRRGMNDRERRKYSDQIISQRFENPQRLYARPREGMRQSELHGDVQSAAEMTAPAPKKSE
jgi:LAGLIDADG endonuclease